MGAHRKPHPEAPGVLPPEFFGLATQSVQLSLVIES
jgi:hypothetical protein